MSLTFAFWSDPAMTIANADGAAVIQGGAVVDRIVYFGSPEPGKTLQAASNPGTDAVEVEVNDAAPGSGAESAAVTLSLSAAGLNTATPGDPLPIGTSIASGAPVAIYVRTAPGALAAGTYTDLELRTNLCIEV